MCGMYYILYTTLLSQSPISGLPRLGSPGFVVSCVAKEKMLRPWSQQARLRAQPYVRWAKGTDTHTQG